jgi:hypothetical protein
MSVPQVKKNFDPMTWCPMMIKSRDQHSYKWHEQTPSALNSNHIYTALNTPDFRGSLKEAYCGQSMQEKQEVIVEEEQKDGSTGDI